MKNNKSVDYIKLFLMSLFPLLLLINFYINKEKFIESSWLFNTENFNQGIWTETINKTFNVFIIWKKLKLLFFLNSLESYFCFFLSVFSIGNFFLILNKLKNKLESLFLSLFISMLFFSFFGLDFFLLQSLSFIPFILLGFIKLKNNSFIKTTVIFLLGSLLCINSFAYLNLIFLLTFVFLLFFAREKITKSSIIALIIPIIIFSLNYNLVPKTDFPNEAKVVEDDGLPGHLRPLFANISNIPFVNRVLERDFSENLSLYLLALTIILFLFNLSKNKEIKVTDIENYLLVFSLFIFGDVYLSEEISSILPIATSKRLIPYFYHLPLSTYFLFFLCFILIFYATKKNNLIVKNLILASLTFFCLSFSKPIFLDQKLNNKIKLSEINNLKDLNLISPSYALLDKLKLDAFKNKDLVNNLKFKSPNLYNVILSKSGFRTPSKKRWLFDKNKQTRFRTKQQYKKEWIHLAFKKTKTIHGVALQTGYYPSDFPRGVRISVSSNCNYNKIENTTDTKNYKNVYEKENWIGSYKFTESGNLYLTAEGIVNLIFKEEVKVKCMLIQQIGENDYFDWSIAEIKLLHHNEKNRLLN